MREIEQQLATFLDLHPVDGRLIVAFSGGCDSSVLLHALARLKFLSNRILAVYINHNLQSQSSHWQQFCRDTACKLGVDFRCIDLDLGQVSSNIEEQARVQRYQAFSAMMSTDDVLLTAHHQDDQAETFLLQLLRGAGLKGLSAMGTVSTFPPGRLFRPLLNFSRQQIVEYARSKAIEWIDDPSNENNYFDRNFLRNEVMPLLGNRWKAAQKTIARSAENCREAAEMIETMSAHDLQNCIGAYKHSLSIHKLRMLPLPSRHIVVRAWIEANDFPLPDRKATQLICSGFIDARQDAQPLMNWSCVRLYRFGDFLYLLGNASFDKVKTVQVSAEQLQQGRVDLPYPAGRVQFEISHTASREQLKKVEISFRQQGQIISLRNRQGNRKLKKLLQEWRVPPWMRNYVPIISVNDKCAAIADFALCEASVPVFKNLQWYPPVELDWRNNQK